ncbi:MAG: hemolysin secretion protein [Rhodospirillales bacterium]|jgi:hemolysin D|nr:hemolysin secretion protein [Rhodospirillales bacterium]
MNETMTAPPPPAPAQTESLRDSIGAKFESIKHHLDIAIQAWRDERDAAKSGAGRAKANRDEMEFMPAALEIMDKPASPLGRGMALAISALLIITLLWSTFGELDTHATANGQLIPSERTKIVQSFDLGIVKAINVTDGQSVKEGDVLIVLDSTSTAADTDRLDSDLVELRLTSARLKALFDDPKNPLAKFTPPANASRDAIELHQRLMRSAADEQYAREQGIANQIRQRRNERLSIETNVSRLRKTLPLLDERVSGIKTLADQGHFPRLRYLELLQDQIDKEKELEMQTHKLAEIDSALAALDEQSRQVTAEFRRVVLDNLKDSEQKIAVADQELIKARQRRGQTQLVAPIDGIVQQLAVHTVGGVVKPADPLMVIVPEGSRLEVQTRVLNRDVGFIHPGQVAAIKLETFPFTKYGTVPGKVANVSGDAIVDEKLGPVYNARISLEKTTMRTETGEIPLSPGMAATVEIKTGKRRVIEYVLAPLFRYRDEALRER